MEDLRKSLAAQPPAVFDKWRTPNSGPGGGAIAGRSDAGINR